MLDRCMNMAFVSVCHNISVIKQIRSVQLKFTKKLPGLRGQTYNDRLAKCSIERLELHCIKQDLILTYKIYFGLTEAAQETIDTNLCKTIVE